MACDILVLGHFVRCGLHRHGFLVSGNLPKDSWGRVDQTGITEHVSHDLLSPS